MDRNSNNQKSVLTTNAPVIKFGTVSDNTLPSSNSTASNSNVNPNSPVSKTSAAGDVFLPPRTQSAPPNAIVPTMTPSTSSTSSSVMEDQGAQADSTKPSASTITTVKEEKQEVTTSKKPLPVNAAPYQPSSFSPAPSYYVPSHAAPYYPSYMGGRGPKPVTAAAPYIVNDPALQYAASIMLSKGGATSISTTVAAGTEDKKETSTATSPTATPLFTPPPARKPVRIQNPLTGEDIKITMASAPKIATPVVPSSDFTSAPVPSAETILPTVTPTVVEPVPIPAIPSITPAAPSTSPSKRGVTIRDPSSGKPVELSGRSAETFKEVPKFQEIESKQVDSSVKAEDKPLEESLSKMAITPDISTKLELHDIIHDEFLEFEGSSGEEETEEEEIDLSGLIKPGMNITYPNRYIPFQVPQDKSEIWRYSRSFLLQFMTVCTQRPDKAAEMARLMALQQRSHLTRGGRRHQKRVYSEAEKQAYLSQLNRAEHAWTPVVDQQQLAENERIVRQIKGVLNKLTSENFAVLFEELKALKLHERPDILCMEVIEIIFDKATMETKFAEMYASLCHRLASYEIESSMQGPGPISLQKSKFRQLLVNHVQTEYNRKREWSQERLQLAAQGIYVKSLATGDLTDSDMAMIKKKRRVLGNMRFIGELYKQKLISPKIMHEILLEMLGNNINDPEEDEVECVCKLFSTVAPSLWELTHALADENLRREFLNHFSLYQQRLSALSNAKGKLSSRVRFMVLDVLETFDRTTRGGVASPSHVAAPRMSVKARRASREYPSPVQPHSQIQVQSQPQQPQPAPAANWESSRKDEDDWSSATRNRNNVTGRRSASPSVTAPQTSPKSFSTKAAATASSTLAPSTARPSGPSKTPSPAPTPLVVNPVVPPAAPVGPRATTPALSTASSSSSLNRFDALESMDIEEPTSIASTPAIEPPTPTESASFMSSQIASKNISSLPIPQASQPIIDVDSEQGRIIQRFLINYAGEYFSLKIVQELALYAKDINDWDLLIKMWLPWTLEKHSSVKHFVDLFVPSFMHIVKNPILQEKVHDQTIKDCLMRAAELQCDYPLVYDFYALFLIKCYLPIKMSPNGIINGKFIKDNLLSSEDPLTSSKILAHVLKHAADDPTLALDMSQCPVDYFKQYIVVFEKLNVLSAFPRLAKWHFEQKFTKLKEEISNSMNSMGVSQVSELVRNLIVSVPANVIREANFLGDICRLLFQVYHQNFVARSISSSKPSSPNATSPAQSGAGAVSFLREEWLPQFLVTLSPILAVEDMRPQDWQAVVQAVVRIEDEDSTFGHHLIEGIKELDIIPESYFSSPLNSPLTSARQSPSKSSQTSRSESHIQQPQPLLTIQSCDNC